MRLPQPFGKYLLLERISVGGMAEVFKAKAFGVEGFEKIIAIKRILPSMAEDADFIQMFIDEAKICSQLNHANVCQVFELGKIQESHFIAMEYIWGKDLLQIQNRFRRLRKNMPLQMAAFIASKVCEGLDYAHRKKDANGKPLNIIHRDVSPQNIIVSYEGEAKVIDFGIAKAASRSSKTQAGVLKGKFGYMSPEQVGAKTLDRRADVFAIGTILYELLTNERLFLGESDFATLEKVRNVAVPPPAQVRQDIPEALNKIIMKALAKEVADRYQWASEMADDLQEFLAQNEPIYNSKQLSSWMRENFASEMKKEGQLLEEQRKIGKEAISAAPIQKSTVPPSARLRAQTLTPVTPTSATSRPQKTPEPEEVHTLIEEPVEELAENDADKGGQNPLSGDAAALDPPGQPQAAAASSEILSESTRVLDPNSDKPSEELPGMATVVFSPGEPQPAPSPAQPAAPAQQPVPQQPAPPMQPAAPVDPYAASALMMAGQMPGQNPSMVGPMTAFPPGMAGPGMPPYGTGAFTVVPAPGGTGMMLLPSGMVPGMFPGQQPPPPPRGGLLKDVLIGVFVAIFVVVVVLGVKYALLPGKGTLILTAIPPHAATIYIDGKEHGRLEANSAYVIRDLPRGPHLMLVRAESGEAQQSFDLNSDMLQLAIPLVASQIASPAPAAPANNNPGSGTIRLRLPPEGALVSINGRLVSDKEVQKGVLVPAGVPNEVKVSKAGKREERFTVTLSPGQEVERVIELKDGRGKLSITSRPAGAEVQINGRMFGKAPVTVDDLDPTKPVKVTVKKRGAGIVTRIVSFEASLEQTLDIDLGSGGKEEERSSSSSSSSSSTAQRGPSPGGATTSSAAPAASGADGFLIANTHPWAKVYIDNKDTGKTTPIGPRDRIPLKPGKHTVTFVTNDKRLSVDVVIRSGEEAKLVRDLNDSN